MYFSWNFPLLLHVYLPSLLCYHLNFKNWSKYLSNNFNYMKVQRFNHLSFFSCHAGCSCEWRCLPLHQHSQEHFWKWSYIRRGEDWSLSSFSVTTTKSDIHTMCVKKCNLFGVDYLKDYFVNLIVLLICCTVLPYIL